ncbi:RNA polymerase sigma factor [Fundidesulfovibrio agrisoli]|uniref:RNA polymerase sigma factor n=1 Tax=Fundidesulfovibrio agrisoli TaxID=2922717 RepID=UPI001FAC99B0|nr:RNA polymerase sigma factor [Fundidesulfovibrio agrisoli]
MRKAQDADPSDAEAIDLVLSGRTDAFAVLVRRHQDYLFALLRRHLPASEVAEVAQEAFIQGFEKLSQLRDKAAFRSWLSSLALRRAIRYWRGVGSRNEVSMDAPGPDGSSWAEAFMAGESQERHEELLRRREAGSVVSWLLGKVKPEDRVALGLFYGRDHELSEIAEMLGWSLEKVKVRLHRARKLMAKALDQAALEGEA